MSTKIKISIGALVLAAFAIGSFAFNAYRVGAFGGHMFGFFRGGCDLSGFEKDSPEWQAKMEEFKASMPERSENSEWRGWGMKGFTDEVNREVIALDNGIQITITSDNPDVVQRLHNWAERILKQ